MEDFSSNKNVAEKEEGELSSDDDDDDNQASNIPESAHSLRTVKYTERQVEQSSTRCKGNTSDTSRNTPGDETHRGCQKSPPGLKRHAASDDQNQLLPKYGKPANPVWNDFFPDDVMNGYYSSDERRPDDFRCQSGREAYESEDHRSVEEVSEPVKRRITVPGDLRHKLSKRRSTAKQPSRCSRSESSASTSVFSRLGPEVENGLSDFQPGLDKKNPREPFSETAEHMCTTNTFPNRNQFPGSTVAHNTTNMHPVHQTTTPKPVSGGASNRKLNDSKMQENQTKTRTAASQEKQELKEYLSKLTVQNQQLREQVFKHIKNNFNGSSNPHEPTTVLRTQFDFDETANVMNALQPNGTAVPDVSVQDVNLCNGTLEKEEQINQLDSGLPQINDETTAKINLTPSLSEFKSEPHDEPKANETNRRHVNLSPLNMVQTYRDKQASVKGITATHGEGHVISPAQTQEEETSAKGITATHDEGHVISPAQTQEETSALEITETHGEGHVRNSAQTQEEKACNNHVSAMEIIETYDQGYVMKTQEAKACNKQDSALEITETHDDGHVMSPAQTQEEETSALEITETHDDGHVMSPAQTKEEKACNNHVSAMEITETHDEGYVMKTQEDKACNKHVSAMEITEIHEGYMMKTQEEKACNKQDSKMEINETHNEGYVMKTQEEKACNKQDSTMEINETHNEGYVMSSTADIHEACTTQAKEITQTQNEDHEMSSAADGNKQASAMENTETHKENNVMNPPETQEEGTCNNQAFENTETHDQGHVISSVAETHDQGHVISSVAETQDVCSKQYSALVINETHDEDTVVSSAADTHEDGNIQDSAKEIIGIQYENEVSCADTQEACNKHVSAMEISETLDHVMSSATVGNKQDSAEEITETHNKNNVRNQAKAQETCNKQASATESPETHEVSFAADLHEACTTQAKEITKTQNEGHVMSAAADGKQASAKENTETHNENNVMSPAETQVEGACNSQALESTETHAEGHVMSSVAETQDVCNKHDSPMESTETHNENNVMSPAETQEDEACNNQALESTETHDQGHVISSVAETQDVCNKHDSSMESNETHDESHVMGPAETQKEEACNKHVSALVINETQDEDNVMNSTADTQEDSNKQDSAKEITETQNGNEAMSFAETQETCNMHVSAMEISKTQDHAISSAADGSKQDSAKEITETRNGRHQ